jgi:hypothetical protein
MATGAMIRRTPRLGIRPPGAAGGRLDAAEARRHGLGRASRAKIGLVI